MSVSLEEFVLELDPKNKTGGGKIYQWSLRAWRKHSIRSMHISTAKVVLNQTGNPTKIDMKLPPCTPPSTVMSKNT